MGVINKQVVYCCHPVLVVCARGVTCGFSNEASARSFLAGRGFRAGNIYRHNGRDWDKLETEPTREWALALN